MAEMLLCFSQISTATHEWMGGWMGLMIITRIFDTVFFSTLMRINEMDERMVWPSGFSCGYLIRILLFTLMQINEMDGWMDGLVNSAVLVYIFIVY